METLPEPKDNNARVLEFLKELMGEDGVAFLNRDNAIATVKRGQPFWQAPFAIGIHALPFLYHWETDIPGTGVAGLEWLVMGLSFQIHPKIEDMTVSDLVGSALEPLEARYNSLSTEIHGYISSDQQAHMLFHTRFALGVLLLLKGDEDRATRILSEMADTKTTRRGPTTSSEGLGHWDVEVTKALAATILQDFYARRQDYEIALCLLTEAVASNGPGYFSESLLAVVPELLDSFAGKCERQNDFGEWVDLFGRAAIITEICGEADTSGDLPSNCKVASPQFLAWKFGQLVARFAIRHSSSLGDSKKIVPNGYQDRGTMENSIFGWGYGDDWLTGTLVASLLLEYDERRNWQILREQYVSMWEALPRYQWLDLCQAGTETDLYWAVKIGFADTFLEFKPAKVEHHLTKFEDAISPKALSDIQDAMDRAYSNLPEGLVHLIERFLEKFELLQERLPPSKQEIVQQLQQRLSSVWSRLPATVIDTLVKAENNYKTGRSINDAKVWFNEAVEASLSCCLVEPLVSFTQKRDDERIAVCFPRGVELKFWYEIRKLHLWEWSNVFETLSVPVHQNPASSGAEDFKRFMKEHFGELPLPALRELSRSLRDFCQYRKDSAHSHPSRYGEEIQELEKMRELVLGIKRLSVITQIFQLFRSSSPNKSSPV